MHDFGHSNGGHCQAHFVAQMFQFEGFLIGAPTVMKAEISCFGAAKVEASVNELHISCFSYRNSYENSYDLSKRCLDSQN